METSNSNIPNLVNATNFQKVLITQALKPDRLHKVMTEFTLNELSKLDECSYSIGTNVYINNNIHKCICKIHFIRI